jgi:hypothetical protein
MKIRDKLFNMTLKELKTEILEEYPHHYGVNLREIASEHFVAWYILTQNEGNLVDLQSTIEDFEMWVAQ